MQVVNNQLKSASVKVTEFTEIYNRGEVAALVVRIVKLKINKNKNMKSLFNDRNYSLTLY